MFSNNNFHPKSTMVESSVFPTVARGDFTACAQKLLEAMSWCQAPWDIATYDNDGHSEKVPMSDRMNQGAVIECRSATELEFLPDASQDLVVTDPPFGGLLHYS